MSPQIDANATPRSEALRQQVAELKTASFFDSREAAISLAESTVDYLDDLERRIAALENAK